MKNSALCVSFMLFSVLVYGAVVGPRIGVAQQYGLVNLSVASTVVRDATIGDTVGYDDWQYHNHFDSTATPARWSRQPSPNRRETLAPMVTRAPIIASPVLAAPMVLSVRGPERYNHAAPTGYRPERGGFIFNRRGWRR